MSVAGIGVKHYGLVFETFDLKPTHLGVQAGLRKRECSCAYFVSKY